MNDPRPFLDLVAYRPIEHALFGGGCLLWVVAYVILLLRIRKLKFVEMPVFAACGNFAWEAVWSIVFVTDMGRFFEWCYGAWFLLDVFIFGHIVAYGHKQVMTPLIARHLKPLAIVGALVIGVLVYAFIKQGLDSPMGARSGYIVQLPISILYFLLLYNPAHRVHLSKAIAWSRVLGTGLVGVFMVLHYPHDAFLLVMVAVSSMLDVVYLQQLHALTRRAAASEVRYV